MQQFRTRLSPQHRGQLPAQVKGIRQRGVKPPAAFGAVRVAGVTGHKGPWDNIIGAALRAVVEALGNPLTHLVNRPPGHFFDIQRVGMKNLLRPGDNVFFVKPDVRRPLVLAQQIQFHIKPAQVTALAGNSHYSPMVFGLDKALDADIGKVCC